MSLTTDVRTRLIAAGITSGDWTCIIGGLTDVDAGPQIAVMERTGLPPLDSHDGPGLKQPGVQLLVRGAARTYAATETKADAVWDALHMSTFGSNLHCRGANKTWLGYEPDTGKPRWSLNFTLIRRY